MPDAEEEKAQPAPLRIPRFINDSLKNKYNFDVKIQDSQRDPSGKPESKVDLVRRLQEAHILMNALPKEIR